MNSSTAELFEKLITRCFPPKNCSGEFSRIRTLDVAVGYDWWGHSPGIYVYIQWKRISLPFLSPQAPISPIENQPRRGRGEHQRGLVLTQWLIVAGHLGPYIRSADWSTHFISVVRLTNDWLFEKDRVLFFMEIRHCDLMFVRNTALWLVEIKAALEQLL